MPLIKFLRCLNLNALWNFLATAADREHWYARGALEHVLTAFFDVEELEEERGITELCIGTIVQLVELEPVRVELVRSERFVKRFCGVIAGIRPPTLNGDTLYANQVGGRR